MQVSLQLSCADYCFINLVFAFFFFFFLASLGGGKAVLQNIIQSSADRNGSKRAHNTSHPLPAVIVDDLDDSLYIFDGKELVDEHYESDSSITASSNF